MRAHTATNDERTLGSEQMRSKLFFSKIAHCNNDLRQGAREAFAQVLPSRLTGVWQRQAKLWWEEVMQEELV